MSLKLNRKINLLNSHDEKSLLLSGFVGNLTKCGNRDKAIVAYIKILKKLKKTYPNQEPRIVLELALEKVKPLVSLRVKKVAGISYNLPASIGDIRACKIGLNWFFNSVYTRAEYTYYNKIVSEISDILNNKGITLQRKQAHERLALDNRSFLHFLIK
jgi:ribosomal protein S7